MSFRRIKVPMAGGLREARRLVYLLFGLMAISSLLDGSLMSVNLKIS
jgi:hypothetical protein